MKTTDRDEAVAQAAREIDPHAFPEKRPLNDALIRRQEEATRKAVKVLNGPMSSITELLDALQEAHSQLAQIMEVARTMNLSQNLSPGAERRRTLLAQFGRLDDDDTRS